MALGGNRSREQPGLRGSESTVSARSARCEETEGRGRAARPPLGMHAAGRCPSGCLGRAGVRERGWWRMRSGASARGRGNRRRGAGGSGRKDAPRPPLRARARAWGWGRPAPQDRAATVGGTRAQRFPEARAGGGGGGRAEIACAGRWDWRGDFSGFPSSSAFLVATRVSHATHTPAAPRGSRCL